ncbi:MAG TPA: T9SS type A sorting domain-containing protein [Ignavibacteriales bacterium]|nr:T9SS type A sorting domain-containing protein [Ignavibacteriales bacterium]
MKLRTIILFVLAFCSQLYAQQEDTTYFPSRLGNTWVYKYDDGRIEVQKIIEDSINQKGYRSLCIKQDSIIFTDKWIFMVSPKQDSVFQYPTSLMELVYRFPIAGSGDKWIVRPDIDSIGGSPEIATVTKTYDAIVFGKPTTAYAISYFFFRVQNGDTVLDFRTWERDEIIAKGFGLIWEGIEVEYKTLIGCVINGDTLGLVPTSVKEEKGKTVPDNFALEQNYPNPFNPTTTIDYSIKAAGNVKLSVFDALGKRIAIVVDEYKPAGSYSVRFDGRSLPSGVYLYRLESGGYNLSKKFILMK